MPTTVNKNNPISVRFPQETKKRLHVIAKSKKRSTSFLIQEAVQNYLELQDWKIQGVKAAIKQMDQGKGIDGDIFLEWMSALGSGEKASRPSAAFSKNIQAC